MHNTVIQVFAKPPVEGLVKTRLIADIGSKSATAIYRHCLQININLIQNSFFDYQLWLTEPSSDPLFDSQPVKYQQGNNLGEKMFHAISDALAHKNYKKVIQMGTDCLDLTTPLLHKVCAKLDQYDLVLVPAWDGGYVLIAAKHAIDNSIFQGIEWGSDRVLKQTLERAMQSGVNTVVLDSLRDIDRVEDLQQYAELKQYL